VHEAGGDLGQRPQTHYDDEHREPGQRSPIQVGRGVALARRHHRERRRVAAIGDGDARRGGRGHRGRDTRHDLVANARRPQSARLFRAPAEHERVAPLQPDDDAAGAGLLDQQRVDRLLSHGMLAALRPLGSLAQQSRVHQAIVHDEVRRPQDLESPSGDQPRVPGTGPDEVDHAGTRRGRLAPSVRHEAIDQAIPEPRARPSVGDSSRDLGPQRAERVEQGRDLRADHPCEAIAQPDRERGTLSRRRNRHREIALPVDRGCDKAAVRQIIDGVEQDPARLRLRPDVAVYGPVIGRRDREKCTREVTRAVGSPPNRDRAGRGEIVEATGYRRADHGHLRPRLDQTGDLLLGHHAATHHDAGPLPKIEKRRVQHHPMRRQKSPKPSPGSRPSR
jgi:hypothetical protein